MLRINLLPAYVSQRRLTKRLVAAFAVLFVLCVLGPLALYAAMMHHLNDISTLADSAEAGKRITDARKAQAAAAIASIKPIQDKLDFVNAVHGYDRQWPALYNTLADTSPRSSLIYTDASVAPASSTMTIKAYSPSVAEVGRYLQAMYQEPDFQTVAVDKVPGYPDNVRHLYFLDGTLVFADAGTNSSTGSGNSSNLPGSGQGVRGGPQSSSNGTLSAYSPDTLGPNAPTYIPPGVGPPPVELTGVPPSPQNGGPANAGAGQAAGGYSPAFLAIADRNISPFALPETREAIRKQYLRRVVMKLAPKGFDITVTATLKQPLTPPVLPGTAPAGAAGKGSGFSTNPPGGPRAQG